MGREFALAFGITLGWTTPGSYAHCNNATTTLRNYADITPLASCKTYTGTIVIATDAPAVIDIPWLEEIQGDFIAANNSNLTTIAGANFVSTTGTVLWQNLPVLTNITLPSWTSSGTLIMDSIPQPTVHDFQQNMQQIDNLYIRNTTFEFLVDFTLLGAQMDILEITNNPFLQYIELGPGNVTYSATITGNSDGMVLALPNLTYTYDLEIADAGAVLLPQLHSVSSKLNIDSIHDSNLSIPELTYVGGDFNITNSSFAQLYLDRMVNVQGSLNIVNNPRLTNLSGLSSVSYVGGMDLVGAFTRVEMISLIHVDGDVNVQSSQALNCSSIPVSLVNGTYTCHAQSTANQSPTPANSPSASASASPRSHHSMSGGAIAGIVVGGTVPAVVAVAVGCILGWRRRQERERGATKAFQDDANQQIKLCQLSIEKDANEVHEAAGEGASGELGSGTAELGRPFSGAYNGPEYRYELGPSAWKSGADTDDI